MNQLVDGVDIQVWLQSFAVHYVYLLKHIYIWQVVSCGNTRQI